MIAHSISVGRKADAWLVFQSAAAHLSDSKICSKVLHQKQLNSGLGQLMCCDKLFKNRVICKELIRYVVICDTYALYHHIHLAAMSALQGIN
jgi:hypothetical protein